MGLFFISEIPVSPVPPKPATASDRLCGCRQDGRSLERYVEEFVELAYLANWPDACLNACFLAGLDEDTIRFKEPACYFSLVEAINLILFLNCSDFVIEEVLDKSCDPRPVSSETPAAWPVRQLPLPSACPSSEHSPGVLPDPKPRMGDEISSTGPKLQRKKKRATKQPKSSEFSASMQPQFPELAVSMQPQTPEFNASVQPESPELSVTVQPKMPVLDTEDWLIDFWAEPAPSLLDLVSAFHVPALTEPAQGSAEPAPAAAAAVPAAPAAAVPAAPAAAVPAAPAAAVPAAPAAAAAAAEPAPTPAAAEPTPTAAGPTPVAHEPFEPLSLPKYFFGGGRVSVGGKDGGGLGDPPWPAEAPDPPWPAEAPDPPWPAEAPDPPWPAEAPDPPWPAKAPDPPWPSLAPDPPWRPPHPRLPGLRFPESSCSALLFALPSSVFPPSPRIPSTCCPRQHSL
ncbi:uncharacterized protein LOC127495915 [Ctenopharyngodon idella]|uniref:uncharacterized protein LOC127495915 n=1 Tax=Ctenopharyngodon idella TaxID=7959 RepID=UPI00222E7041|nr:uncharacterized protein LOC127495915 [Ctenopharyngodon idella]